MTPRWTVKARRMGRVHIMRWWVTCRDGVEIDKYETRELADAYCAYMNRRDCSDLLQLTTTPRPKEANTT